MRRVLTTCLGIGTALLLIGTAACGGGDDTDEGDATSAATTAATAAPTSAPTEAPTDGGEDDAPAAPALGALIDAGGSTVRVNGVVEPTPIEGMDEVPEDHRLLAFDVSMVGTGGDKEYNHLFFGLIDQRGENVAVRVDGVVSADGNPGALRLFPQHPPIHAGLLGRDRLVRGFVHMLAPTNLGPLTFAILDERRSGWVMLANLEGAAEPAEGALPPPRPVAPDGLPNAGPGGTAGPAALGDSLYTVREVLDPAPTNDEAPPGIRFVALDILQEAREADERINLLDFAVQDTDGYFYPAFFDFGMSRPTFESSQAAEGGTGSGLVTFAVREDAELVLLLAKPDFEAAHEPIAVFASE